MGAGATWNWRAREAGSSSLHGVALADGAAKAKWISPRLPAGGTRWVRRSQARSLLAGRRSPMHVTLARVASSAVESPARDDSPSRARPAPTLAPSRHPAEGDEVATRPRSLDGVSGFMGLRWEDPETVRLTIRPELINARRAALRRGHLRAGRLLHGLDAVGADDASEERIATINISINYIQTATEGEIVCRTTLDRRNRTIAVMRSEVRHEDGRLLVTAIGSYSIFPPRSSASRAAGVRSAAERAAPSADPDRADDRRLGLRRRRRHPGRPEGVRALRRARHERDHRDHRAEHASASSAIHPVAAGDRARAGARGARGHRASTRSRSGMLGTADGRARGRAGARRAAAGHARGRGPGDGRRVGRAPARRRRRSARSSSEILPRASVLTPNLPEARVARPGLAPRRATPASADRDGRRGRRGRGAARGRCWRSGPRAVVLTGGHRDARRRPVPRLRDERRARSVEIEGERHPDGAAHGSGCTHSSVLAAQLALGRTPLQAARVARALAGAAVAHGLRDVGAGAGPVDVIGLAARRAGAPTLSDARPPRLP